MPLPVLLLPAELVRKIVRYTEDVAILCACRTLGAPGLLGDADAYSQLRSDLLSAYARAIPQGAAAIGGRVHVWWDLQGTQASGWYPARVENFNARGHQLHYAGEGGAHGRADLADLARRGRLRYSSSAFAQQSLAPPSPTAQAAPPPQAAPAAGI